MQEWWSRRWLRRLRWLLRDGGFEGCATEALKVALAPARWRESERARGGVYSKERRRGGTRRWLDGGEFDEIERTEEPSLD
ncbi:hypothetical protein S245_004340 [Arachis hypogaea]